MSNPIPARLLSEFFGYMSAHDDDDLPDGAWFALLEESAERFIGEHALRNADPNDATHQYLRMSASKGRL